MPREFIRLTVNAGGTRPRREKLENRWHLVAPAALLPAEGVVTGSRGAVFYPKKENKKAISSWNHRPIVVDHPRDDEGTLISACSKEVIDARKIGITLNTSLDDKVRTECWFDEDKCKSVDAGLYKKIKAGKKIEISTGLYADNDGVTGNHAGEQYEGTARDHKPDHLACLPSAEGAYSVEAGGGLFANRAISRMPARNRAVFRRSLESTIQQTGLQMIANELSFTQVTSMLVDLLAARFGERGKYWAGWVWDVYDNAVVFGDRGKIWRIEYTRDGDSVALSGDAIEVVRSVSYVAAAGGETFAANAAGLLVPQSGKEKSPMAFNKKAHIDALIGNGGMWVETDRPALEALPDASLEKIKLVGNTTPSGTTQPTATTGAATAPPPVANTAPAAPRNAAEYVAAAPAGPIRDALTDLLANAEIERSRMIKQILLVPQNQFSEADLTAAPIGNIRKLHASMVPAGPPAGSYGTDYSPLFGEGAVSAAGIPLTANYAGNGGGPAPGAAPAPNQYLGVPGLDALVANQTGVPATAAK